MQQGVNDPFQRSAAFRIPENKLPQKMPVSLSGGVYAGWAEDAGEGGFQRTAIQQSARLRITVKQAQARAPAFISRRMNVDFPVAIPPVTIRVFMGGRESKALLGYKERVKGLPFHPLQYGRYARSLHGRQQAFGGGKGAFRSGRSGKGIAAYGLARGVNDLSRYEDHQILLDVVVGVAAEEAADERQVTEDRHFVFHRLHVSVIKPPIATVWPS